MLDSVFSRGGFFFAGERFRRGIRFTFPIALMDLRSNTGGGGRGMSLGSWEITARRVGKQKLEAELKKTWRFSNSFYHVVVKGSVQCASTYRTTS